MKGWITDSKAHVVPKDSVIDELNEMAQSKGGSFALALYINGQCKDYIELFICVYYNQQHSQGFLRLHGKIMDIGKSGVIKWVKRHRPMI